MATNYNQFLISSADVIIRDREADQIMLYGKTEIDSAMQQDVASLEISGGQGNQLLYDAQHSKKLTFTITDAKFDEGYIAVNSGVLITNGAKDIFYREFITLDASGVGTITKVPTGTGKVYLQNATGTVLTVAPTGSTVTWLAQANNKVEAIYKYSTTVDSIDLNAAIFTKSYEMTLIGHIFDKSGNSAELQIIIPQYKPDGKFSLTLKADGYSTTPLNGKALVDQVTSSYGSMNIVNLSGSAIVYTNIVASPSTVTLSTTTTTQQITVYALRGGNYAPVTLDLALCSFTSGTPATATVGASTGLITRVAVGTSLVTVTHTASGLKDYVNVTCV